MKTTGKESVIRGKSPSQKPKSQPNCNTSVITEIVVHLGTQILYEVAVNGIEKTSAGNKSFVAGLEEKDQNQYFTIKDLQKLFAVITDLEFADFCEFSDRPLLYVIDKFTIH